MLTDYAAAVRMTNAGLLGGQAHGLTALNEDMQPHFRVEVR